MTDRGGLYEHALFDVPRPEHGYCVDDVSRALVVVCREPLPDAAMVSLRAQYLSFVLDAQTPTGTFRNRRDVSGHWQDATAVDDCWGRAMWGLGVAATTPDSTTGTTTAAGNSAALRAFERGGGLRSPWSRATAFAALGAAAVLDTHPGHPLALSLLRDATQSLDGSGGWPDWPWPEPRLRYANAVVPEALVAAGAALGDAAATERGLQLLSWLLARETDGARLSPTPVGGRGPTDRAPGFDQQPIEVAALADACARAFTLTRAQRWADAVTLAAEWFLGRNDSGIVMYDEATGAGYDGLERAGRNANQGAESTLAALSTLQQARRTALCVR